MKDAIDSARSAQQTVLVVSIVTMIAIQGPLTEEFEPAKSEAERLAQRQSSITPGSLSLALLDTEELSAAQIEMKLRRLLSAVAERTTECRLTFKFDEEYRGKIDEIARQATIFGTLRTVGDVDIFLRQDVSDARFAALDFSLLETLDLDGRCPTGAGKGEWITVDTSIWKSSGTLGQLEMSYAGTFEFVKTRWVPIATIRSQFGEGLFAESHDDGGRVSYTFLPEIRQRFPEVSSMTVEQVPAYVNQESGRANVLIDVFGVKVRTAEFLLGAPFMILFLLGGHLYALRYAVQSHGKRPMSLW